LPKIVKFANQFQALTDGKQGFWFGFILLPAMIQCSIMVVIFYNGTQEAAKDFFSPLFELVPVVDKTQVLPYDSLNSILNTMDTMARRGERTDSDTTYTPYKSMGPRKSLRGSNVTLPLDTNFIQSIYNKFNDILSQHPQTRDSRLLFELLPNSQLMKVSNHPTAFASRGPYYNVSSLFRWHESNLDQRIRLLQRELMDQIGARAGIARQPGYEKSKQGTGLYANYAGKLDPAIN
jgi:hypothetical protein